MGFGHSDVRPFSSRTRGAPRQAVFSSQFRFMFAPSGNDLIAFHGVDLLHLSRAGNAVEQPESGCCPANRLATAHQPPSDKDHNQRGGYYEYPMRGT